MQIAQDPSGAPRRSAAQTAAALLAWPDLLLLLLLLLLALTTAVHPEIECWAAAGLHRWKAALHMMEYGTADICHMRKQRLICQPIPRSHEDVKLLVSAMHMKSLAGMSQEWQGV